MPNHSLRMSTPRYLNLIGPTLQQLSQNRVADRVSPDLAIRKKAFSSGTLAQTQASGDLESIGSHHRQAMQLNLGTNQAATVEAMVKALAPGGRTRRSTPHQERRRLLRHR